MRSVVVANVKSDRGIFCDGCCQIYEPGPVESFMAKSGIKSKICKFYPKNKIKLRG